jgi:hypothetical protein
MGDLCAGVAAVSKLPPWFAGLQRPTLILSLCDYSGVWSQPYVDDAYDVVRVDLKHGQDVRLLELPDRPVHGILAAPPCTVFANSGARWERTDDEMRGGPVDRGRLLSPDPRHPARLVGAGEPRRQAVALPRSASDDVPAKRLRRPVYEADLSVGRVQHAHQIASGGLARLEDAPRSART